MNGYELNQFRVRFLNTKMGHLTGWVCVGGDI